ncbi:hypothetical protein K9M79_00010 [Candidatus Woesearchaeota archaeon]|nr:hypothetical protein [Candidatus Woesearchaeota archaeon]
MKRILLIGTLLIIVIMTSFVTYSDCCKKFCISSNEMDCCGPSACHEFDSSECNSIEYCNVGCCTDLHGIKHAEYPQGLCIEKGGSFSSESCGISSVCTSR